MVDNKAATPSAARNFLNTVRALMKFAMETGIRPDNPTIGVKRVKIKTASNATWTEDDIARFETKHPIEYSAPDLPSRCYSTPGSDEVMSSA